MKLNFLLGFILTIVSLGVLADLPPDQQCEANAINYQQAVIFVKKLEDAVKNNDKKTVAELGDYPVRINIKKKSTYIKNKKEFIKSYNNIFTSEVKSLLFRDKTIFCNYQGAATGYGTVWFWAGKEGANFYVINVSSK